MESTVFAASLSINILSNLTYDLLKRARGRACIPVDSAITKTVEVFPQLEGLKGTLEQWLVSPTVRRVLEKYTKGLKGLDDVKIDSLAETLIGETQFFLPEEAAPTAREIVSTFLAEVRDEYLKTPELGLPLIANRVEEVARSAAGVNVLMARLEEVKARLPAAAGLSGESAFDSQLGGHLLEALRFAYLVLRRNFREAEAQRAYLAAMLPTGPRPEIPSVDVTGPGTAVAFREEGATQEEWRVIEEDFEPDPGLQEISPNHFYCDAVEGQEGGRQLPRYARIRDLDERYHHTDLK